MVSVAQDLGRWRLSTYLLSVGTVALLVYVYLPIMTFLTSPGEIDLHLDYLLHNNVGESMVAVYLAGVLYSLAISPRMRTLLTLAAVTGLFTALFYSFILPLGYPAMNGLMFEQIPITALELAARTTLDAILLVLIIVATTLSINYLGGRGLVTAILLVNVILTSVGILEVRRDTLSGTEPTSVEAGTEAPLQFSRHENNVLILILDRFMGGFVEEILEKEPQLATELDGFQWYPLTVAAGDNSISGVHPILGGYDYTPPEMNSRNGVLRDISVEAYRLLPYNFSRSGYTVNVVNPRGLGFTMKGDCSFLEMDDVTCSHIPVATAMDRAEEFGVPTEALSRSNYADLLVLLGLMRSSPYAIKEVLSERGPWRPFLDHSAGTTFRQWAELKSLPTLTSSEATTSSFNLLWNILPHEPYYLSKDCNPMPVQFEVPAEVFRKEGYASMFAMQHANAARCSLLLVSDYFRWMKQAGVYDNTKIVIVSDHGIIGPVEDHSSRALRGGSTASVFVRSRSVLLVKELRTSGPLRTSEAFLTNAEVPRIVCEEIGGCVNPYLDDKPVQTLGRDQPFVVSIVPWQFSQQKRNAFVIGKQLVLTDRDPYDRKNWREVENEPWESPGQSSIRDGT
ncbi:MAG: hypothetical protein K8J08_11945 [Thermoanaerobaculia bacterium]|nr:hypothetical protein [Thermoanaerobaculia bacterium]